MADELPPELEAYLASREKIRDIEWESEVYYPIPDGMESIAKQKSPRVTDGFYLIKREKGLIHGEKRRCWTHLYYLNDPELQSEASFDGTNRYSINWNRRQGMITTSDQHVSMDSPLSPLGDNFVPALPFSRSLSEILKGNCELVSRGDNFYEIIGAERQRLPNGKWDHEAPLYHLEVELSADHGYLPARLELFEVYNGQKVTARRCDVEMFVSVNGTWVPKSFSYSRGKNISAKAKQYGVTGRLKVELLPDSLRLNTSPTDDRFRIEFPADGGYWDERTDQFFGTREDAGGSRRKIVVTRPWHWTAYVVLGFLVTAVSWRILKHDWRRKKTVGLLAILLPTVFSGCNMQTAQPKSAKTDPSEIPLEVDGGSEQTFTIKSADPVNTRKTFTIRNISNVPIKLGSPIFECVCSEVSLSCFEIGPKATVTMEAQFAVPTFFESKAITIALPVLEPEPNEYILRVVLQPVDEWLVETPSLNVHGLCGTETTLIAEVSHPAQMNSGIEVESSGELQIRSMQLTKLQETRTAIHLNVTIPSQPLTKTTTVVFRHKELKPHEWRIPVRMVALAPTRFEPSSILLRGTEPTNVRLIGEAPQSKNFRWIDAPLGLSFKETNSDTGEWEIRWEKAPDKNSVVKIHATTTSEDSIGSQGIDESSVPLKIVTMK